MDAGAGLRRLRRRRREVWGRVLAELGAARRRLRKRWLVLSVLLFVIAAMFATAAVVYAHYAEDLPSVEGFGTASLSQVTRVFASDGKTLLMEHYLQNRTVVDLPHISPDLQNATIAVEDKDFYSHSGVDPVRVVGAAIYDLTHRQSAQGASTITQQVVKSAVLKAPERSLSRKIKELILATQLEAHYDKRRILEMYLNNNSYANANYGIETAAQAYFHVHAKDLQLPEASFLAGIPQSPSRYDPLTSDGYAATRERQKVVLDAMVRAGYISRTQADAAFAKDLAAEIKTAAPLQLQPQTGVAPHFADYVLDQLYKKYGQTYVDHAGLTVVTTLDPHAQDILTRAVHDEVDAVAKVTRQGRDPVDGQATYGPNNGAAIVISPQTGAVLAMVGSYDYNQAAINGARNNTVGSQLDYLGTQLEGDPHEVGSSFKGYVYSTALANGYSPSSTLQDANGHLPGFDSQGLSDWDFKQLGNISLAYSIQQSRNISSARLLQAMSVPRVFATAEALGIPAPSLRCFSGRTEIPCGLSVTLGVTPLAMIDHVAAYGAFANGGRRVHPWVVAKITDNTGRVVLDQRTPTMEQAIPAHVAVQMADILKGAERPGGWNLSIPFGNKSGTTEHFQDSYFVGFSSDLAIGAWMGHTDAHGVQSHMNTIFGENGAGYIMRDFVRGWYSGSSPPDFGQPDRPLDPCHPQPRASPSPSPSPSRPPSPSGSPRRGAPTPPPGYPRAPYQYPDVQPVAAPAVPLSVLCATPSPGPQPSGGPIAPSPQPSASGTPGSPPPGPIIVEPTPSDLPSPHPTCTVLQPFCH